MTDSIVILCAIVQVPAEMNEVIKRTMQWRTPTTRIWERPLMVG